MAFSDYIKNKKKVGVKTDKKTFYKGKPVGRNMFVTPQGKPVSELSTTFSYGGKMINIPTIHRGYQFNQRELRDMLDEGLIKPTSKSKANITNPITGNPASTQKRLGKKMGKKADKRSRALEYR